ncbi:MAG: hypothetical protein FWB91_03500 [Defluviitaleaceae bacterium]|nr:hypothetical protein [Defluviitaleaceae bacterium]
MTTTKSALNVEIDKGMTIIMERQLSIQPKSSPSLDEQIREAALRRNPKRVTLQTDDNGNVIVDKDEHPDIYDWALNG